MNSDQIVEALQPYGVVSIFQHDDKTWSAKCKLFVHGMSAEVKSGYNYRSMLAALEALQTQVGKVTVTPTAVKLPGKEVAE